MGGASEKVIAVVGVSERTEKFGYRIFRDLAENGYHVWAVNPNNGEILGRKIYKSLSELPEVPDLVITVVTSKVTEAIVEECKELGIKEIWMQPGSESRLAIDNAKKYGINVVYNACFMVKEGIW
ncbi:MAG: CoA-binding protein [Candidatus Omnitrophota bacterium]